MKNMKVSMKLIVSFIILIAMAAVIGIVGIVGMYNINKSDDEMYQMNLLAIAHLADIRENYAQQTAELRALVLEDNTSQAFADAKKTSDDLQAEMDGLIKAYEPTVTDPEDQRQFDIFKNTFNNEFLPYANNIEQLTLDGKDDEATVQLNEAGDAIAEKISAALAESASLNNNAAAAAVESNTKLFTTMLIIELVIIVAAAVVAFLLVFYINGLISKPLDRMREVLVQVGSTGSMNFSPEQMRTIDKDAEAKDEIGQSVLAFTQMMKRLMEVGGQLEQVAGGDLTVETTLLSNQDTLGASLDKMVKNLNNMFNEINSATAQVSTGASQVSDGAQALAQGSTEQAASIQELSSSISEIAEKTRENAEKATKAAGLSGEIRSNAQKGSEQMGEMMQAVRDINEASQNISKVIKVIDDIAFQTNILALNAAVEAARAGQHGKGFAVVAEEVRNLAAKSAEAAKDTGTLIENSIEKANLGARIADETSSSLNDIVDGINESTTLVSEIAQGSEEQSVNISQINTGIDQVAQVVQQNSATAEQSAAASEEMSGQAEMLSQLVGQFRIKDSNYTGLPAAHVAPAKRLPQADTSYSGNGPIVSDDLSTF